MQYAIGQIEHRGRTLYILADAYGNPKSFGYRTRELAESVARLIESQGGNGVTEDPGASAPTGDVAL